MNISCCKSYVGKQIIGLLPNESECLFYYSPNVDVQAWKIDGTDSIDVVSVNGILNPYGYLYNIFSLSDGTYRFILSYIGTSAPTYIPAITDDIGDPVTYTLTNCCDLVCLEGTFNAADAVYLQTGYGWNWYNGAAIFNHTSVEEAIKSFYGTQTIYTATDNGDGSWYVKIDNAYVCNPPLAWSGDDLTYTDMVPCSPPASECLYIGFIDLNGGGSLSDYTLDDNTTPLVNDAYGNGYLRTLMQSNSGDIYGLFYDPSNFISQGIHLIYQGTSATNIDVHLIGNYWNTIYFSKATDSFIDCRPIFCYSLTFSTNYASLTNIQFASAPNILSSDLTASAPAYNNINFSNTFAMEDLIKSIYGSQATYTYTDNGDGTITISFNNVYDFGNPILTLVGKGTGPDNFDMIDC